jgi:hypothetical protein
MVNNCCEEFELKGSQDPQVVLQGLKEFAEAYLKTGEDEKAPNLRRFFTA